MIACTVKGYGFESLLQSSDYWGLLDPQVCFGQPKTEKFGADIVTLSLNHYFAAHSSGCDE